MALVPSGKPISLAGSATCGGYNQSVEEEIRKTGT